MKQWLIDANLWMTEEEHENEDTAEREAAREYQEARKIEITESQGSDDEEELAKNLENTKLIDEICAGVAKLTTNPDPKPEQSGLTDDDEKSLDEEKLNEMRQELQEKEDEYAAMLEKLLNEEEATRRENERIQHIRNMEWESDYWDDE